MQAVDPEKRFELRTKVIELAKDKFDDGFVSDQDMMDVGITALFSDSPSVKIVNTEGLCLNRQRSLFK